jgi:hypothetical protein
LVEGKARTAGQRGQQKPGAVTRPGFGTLLEDRLLSPLSVSMSIPVSKIFAGTLSMLVFPGSVSSSEEAMNVPQLRSTAGQAREIGWK